MAAPSYALSLATANSTDPAGDIITLTETQLTAAGWVFIEQTAFTQAATARVMRVWKCPGTQNAAGTDFYIGLVKNAVAGIYIAARAFEGYNATAHTMQHPCISGAATHFPVGGFSWIARTMPAAGYSAVAYGNGVFVAITSALGTGAAVSQDGITWTATVLPASQKWYAVAYGNGVFVAVGGPGTISATSPDGVTWTQRVIGAISATYLGVAYGNGTFVAVGGAGTTASTSSDGITWTNRTVTNTTYTSIAYGAGLFVAVRSGSTAAISSPDGITWTTRTLSTTNPWNSVAYGGGMFVAVAGGATTVSNSSPDGMTWTARTVPVGTYTSVTYGNGLFFAQTGSATNGASSPDGITWTARTVVGAMSTVCGNSVGQFVTVASGSTAAGSWDYDPNPNWSAGNKDWLSDGSIAPAIAEAQPTAVLAVSTSHDVAVLASRSYLVLGVYAAGTGTMKVGWILGLINPVYPDSPASFPPLAVITTAGAATAATGGVSRPMRSLAATNAFGATTGPESLLLGTAFVSGVNEPAANLLRTARVAVGGSQTAAFAVGYRGWLSDSVAVGIVTSGTSAKLGDTLTIGASTYTVLATSGGTPSASFQGAGACAYAFDVTAGS